MRKLQATILVTSLGLSLAIAPPVQAKAKITKPSAPTISAISSSTSKKGKVNVTVTITLPASNGGSKITGSKVSLGGKSCTIAKTKTSCTIKSIKNGKALSVYANSKNIKGFGNKSALVVYSAGASAWRTTPAVTVVVETPAEAAPAPIPTPAPLTCATGGTCVVGDRGPGGGIVYYVDNAGFSCGESYSTSGSPTGGLCNYLEVAPSGWNDIFDPMKPWAVTANESRDVFGITNDSSANNSSTGIGLGFKNSELIIIQNGVYDAATNDYAAGAARAYAGNSKRDWYLPTTTELNLLCQWARNVTQVVGTRCRGGTGVREELDYSSYWSSSGLSATLGWIQRFDDGSQTLGTKGSNKSIRPVRAF